MSSSQDGKRFYEYGRASQAVYEVRGNRVHEYGRATQAKYELW